MTETLYKLTSKTDETRNGTKWGQGVTHEADGNSLTLCNDRWIHAYRDPYLALLMNPVHADLINPHLWECTGVVGLDQVDKIGCTQLTTVKRIRKPRITLAMRRRFAVLAAIEVYDGWSKYDQDKQWITWAKDYLDGKPSSKAAGGAAAAGAWAEAAAMAEAAAAEAAAAAMAAAEAEARAGSEAAARAGARAGAMAAAWAAARAGDTLDLVAIARKACEQ